MICLVLKTCNILILVNLKFICFFPYFVCISFFLRNVIFGAYLVHYVINYRFCMLKKII